MTSAPTWCVVVPMANEEQEFAPFVSALSAQMDALGGGHAVLVVDHVSVDRTRALCEELAARDARYSVEWAPQNRNVVDAYINGFRAALRGGHEYIIEMDAGLSHDPAALPLFLDALKGGYDCAFGSRFIAGGSMATSPWSRQFLSRAGSWAAQVFLGARVKDMTSGYEGFRREVLEKLVRYPLRSRAHFYQTEVRYLLRHRRWIELPISYRAPSPRVSRHAVRNAFACLGWYAIMRLQGRGPAL